MGIQMVWIEEIDWLIEPNQVARFSLLTSFRESESTASLSSPFDIAMYHLFGGKPGAATTVAVDYDYTPPAFDLSVQVFHARFRRLFSPQAFHIDKIGNGFGDDSAHEVLAITGG